MATRPSLVTSLRVVMETAEDTVDMEEVTSAFGPRPQMAEVEIFFTELPQVLRMFLVKLVMLRKTTYPLL